MNTVNQLRLHLQANTLEDTMAKMRPALAKEIFAEQFDIEQLYQEYNQLFEQYESAYEQLPAPSTRQSIIQGIISEKQRAEEYLEQVNYYQKMSQEINNFQKFGPLMQLLQANLEDFTQIYEQNKLFVQNIVNFDVSPDFVQFKEFCQQEREIQCKACIVEKKAAKDLRLSDTVLELIEYFPTDYEEKLQELKSLFTLDEKRFGEVIVEVYYNHSYLSKYEELSSFLEFVESLAGFAENREEFLFREVEGRIFSIEMDSFQDLFDTIIGVQNLKSSIVQQVCSSAFITSLSLSSLLERSKIEELRIIANLPKISVKVPVISAISENIILGIELAKILNPECKQAMSAFCISYGIEKVNAYKQVGDQERIKREELELQELFSDFTVDNNLVFDLLMQKLE